MYVPETEDMLPRAAPRPCAPVPLGHTDEIVKPTVPEVSILFGQPPQQQLQQAQQQQHQQQSAPTQPPLGSFDSWKKQLLPRVNFSPVLATELGPTSPPIASSAGITSAAGCSEYNYLPRPHVYDVDRSTPPQPLQVNYAVNVPSPYTRETFSNDVLVSAPRLQHPSTQPQCHCQPPPTTAISDVLTICAGTQTDPEINSCRRDSTASVSELSNLANKNDVKEILTQLEIMRQEHQFLRRLCESLTQQQQQQQKTSSKTYKETSSQCEILPMKSNATVKRTTPIVHDYIVEEDEHGTAYEMPPRALPQYQSPRSAPPMAQSTGYRPNTPQGKQPVALQSPATNSPAMGPVLTKPSTEKSLVMNELARKYLPQKQINELMDEMRLSPKTTPAANDAPATNTATNTTPLRQIDNFHQSPSNISNASYVYLKKYRLLPEQRLPYDHHANMVKLHNKLQSSDTPVPSSPQAREPMLDLDNIRNQPKLI